MKNLKKRKGFTLAEILIVVALLGILMTVLLVSVGTYFDKTRETGVRNDFNNMKTAIETVMRENSGLPKKTGKASSDTSADAKVSFDKTVNLINDYLDPNMKWVDGVDDDSNGFVVVDAVEGVEPKYSMLSDADAHNNDGHIVSTKTDPWKYNYSIYFQRRNEPAVNRNSAGDKVGRLDKVLVTSWGSKGNEKEAQYAMLIEYDKGTITIAQAGFQGENLNTLKVGVVDQTTSASTASENSYFVADKATVIDRKNAVGQGYNGEADTTSNNGNTQNAPYTAIPVRNLIYGSIIGPDTLITTDINNFGNANLSQFDAQAFNS